MGIIASELERIRERDGRIVASVVVAEAAPEEAPLHGSFTWDDAQAGHQYRLIQARQLIRGVVVAVADGSTRAAYVHVPDGPGEGYYQSVEVVVGPDRAEEYARALGQLRAHLGAAARALRDLEQAAADNPVRAEVIGGAARAVAAAEEAVAALR